MSTNKSILSHEKLGITFAELGALIATREMLAMGMLRHDPSGTVEAHKHKFDMNTPCKRYECGTVACIGGTMAIIMGKNGYKAYDYVSDNRPLHDLFWLPMDSDYAVVTPAIAVKAIDNFLYTGNPNWEDILP